jgi:2'-5' RNA ligase
MDIKNKLRQVLLEAEKKDHKRDYGCLMVFLNVDKKAWKELQDMISEDDLYTEEGDDGYGRENEPHVTILYGLHGDIEDEDLEVEIDKIGNPKIEFKAISTFDNEKFDVLKFDVKSADLNKLNKVFSKFPNTNKFPDYHPHATVAYLKKGTAEKYIKDAKDLVKMNIDNEKIVYSKVDGSTKNYKIKKEV